MTEEEARQAVLEEHTEVIAWDAATGDEYGRGVAIAYSMVPTLTIRREDGTRFSWRHDLCDYARSRAMFCGCPFPESDGKVADWEMELIHKCP